jgi:RNA polymerase sigma factor (sigma-70 family)
MEEPSILERVAAGDPAAPSECITRFSGLVWSLARRLSSSASDAEDAVQEIFIDLWKSAARFDSSIASETTFVAMIARRRLIDRGRRKMRRPEVPQIAETVTDRRVSVDRSELGEQQSIAQRAFRQLRPEQQQVLQLAIHHGCSHEQIATATGMPLGTVKTHARRGLIKIRQILAEQGMLSPEEVARASAVSSDGASTRSAADAASKGGRS